MRLLKSECHGLRRGVEKAFAAMTLDGQKHFVLARSEREQGFTTYSSDQYKQ